MYAFLNLIFPFLNALQNSSSMCAFLNLIFHTSLLYLLHWCSCSLIMTKNTCLKEISMNMIKNIKKVGKQENKTRDSGRYGGYLTEAKSY